MENEFDINKITAEFAKASLESIAIGIASKIKGAKNAFNSKFKRTYKEYLQRLLDRNTKTKSFFSRAEPHTLYDFFVPLDLSNDRRTLSKATIESIISVSSSAIIVGSGGCGKSMLMRHLLINTVKSKQKIPIFLEFRKLNSSDTDLRANLLQSIHSDGLEVDDEYFELSLKEGHYCILLDGFDELNYNIRRTIADQVQGLSRKYPKNWFIISSRGDSNLQGWTLFSEYYVEPLNLVSAVELVKKLPFEDFIKEKFIKDLQDNLFDLHSSLLSNPLLLSIMLLTYRDIAHIPNKLSIFYNQAYESLFEKHDAFKEGYQREKRTNLDVQDFAKVFSALAIQSYDKEESSFSRTKVLEYLEKAKSISNVSYSSVDYLEDAKQAVCLLIEDGLEITYTGQVLKVL